MPIVLVPGSKSNLFFTLVAARKGLTTNIEKSGSSLDLGSFSVQLTRLDSIDHLDLTLAKESNESESTVCAISEKTFGKEIIQRF